MKGVLHESKEGLTYVTGIMAIVVDYVDKYQENEGWFKKLLEKYNSPVSVMVEFYRMMVNQKEFEPIENSEDKQAMEGHSWSADVLCTDGKDYFLENYNAELKYWSCSGVTHWQQIIPPKK